MYSQFMDTPTIEPVNQRVKPNSRNTGAAVRIRKIKRKFPDLTNSEIAQRVGCDKANVHRVLKRFLGDNSESDLAEFQQAKADVYDRIQLRTLMSIDDATISKAPLMARVTSAAILEDKARLIRGQATAINVTVLLDAVEAIRAMRKAE